MTRTETTSPLHASVAPLATKGEQAAFSYEVEAFKRGMEKFAAMFTAHYGLKLVFQGTRAETDGKTIYVPELALFARSGMSPEEIAKAREFLQVTRGYVYHEGAHIMFTEFDLMPKARSARGERFAVFCNLLEDLRVEARIGSIYPGAKEALTVMRDWVWLRINEKLKDGSHIPDAFMQLIYAMSLVGNYEKYTSHAVWRGLTAKQALTKAVKHSSEIRKIAKAPTTAALYKLALDLWDRISDPEEETPPSDKLGDGKGSAEGEKDDPDSKNDRSDGDPSDGDDFDGDSDDHDETSSGEGSSDDSSSDREDSAGEDEGPVEPEDGEETGDDESMADGAGESDDDSSEEMGSGEEGKDEGRDSDAGKKSGTDETDDEPSDDGDSASRSEGDSEALRDEEATIVFDGETENPEDVSDLLKAAAVKAASLIPSREKPYLIYSTAHDYIGPPPELKGDDLLNAHAWTRRLENDTSFVAGVMERWLRASLQSATQSLTVRGREEGHLDMTNIYKLPMAQISSDPRLHQDAAKVFYEEVIGRSLKNTAVALSIDNSGSMSSNQEMPDFEKQYAHERDAEKRARYVANSKGMWRPSKSRLASMTAFSLAKGLDRIGVQFDMTAWTTDQATHTPRMSHADYGLYTRHHALKVLNLKTFEEKWPTVKHRVRHISGQRCNYDGESIRIAAQRLLARPEQRKVLFVICDGIPGPEHGEDASHFDRHLMQICDDIRALKRQDGSQVIELMCISIQSEESARYYQRPGSGYVNVKVPSQLPTVVIDALKRVLIGGTSRHI